ncbi:MAG: NADP-dependent malic enzyme [Clostridia bacterium]|nr:NADP-dependent malic enzyme [Clostridia bacterium]
MDYAKESLKCHYNWKGKIEVVPRATVTSKEELSLAYTPGVAQPCLEIQKDINKSYELTRRWNLVAVITDGTAVLGLGDIGPEAGMPVMEGKCVLFKAFADVDAFPLCVKSKDVDEIVRTISLISGSFGGINLEDIAAPRCFEIERKLKECTDIPIFHDDQHGTAVVCAAAVINAVKVVGKKLEDCTVAFSGAGAAGCAIAKLFLQLGVKEIYMCDRQGILNIDDPNIMESKKDIASITNFSRKSGTLADAMKGADIFVGVSAPGVVTEEMVASMAPGAIVMPMANPVPEIMPDLALKAGAAVVGTGRSDFPNQINNVLAFPGIFRGALDVRAKDINEEMKIAAAKAIASLVSDEELSAEYIIPKAFDERVGKTVAAAVAEAARKTGVNRI